MQRRSFWKLYDRCASLHRAACNRIFTQAEMTETSASPVLLFAATALFLLLAILEIDLFRDELRALGLVAGKENDMPSLVGP
jgi:hypothetical protein